ncbi:hypothetical protein EQW78_10355 [Oerskovia turbata]|uniref:DUF6545 domain-containing protein n=1 Tax=Oerskovia turbata TaxID=1713 RepID=A0A4Q1KWR4_9CELL|nr:DUF6545 domain-containing protein [Oerskovia turbata]RXR23826.1 hypothetical protein EQW73_14545 [Oerskovia turbata]RXR33704.1 hypothetical protein EQW78_10355 [Oerskovia turbata]TGJ96880.1 hypothetical protein DLJ96_02125 [Actinotalea fermentans ATCC 43279 = JCM 9966 = DSM 3133]
MTYLAFLLFAGAAGWTALRHRSHLDGDRALTWALGLVAAASALRIHAVESFLLTSAPAGFHELAKHSLLVAGCLCIAAWVQGTQGRRPRPRHVVVGVVGVVSVLVVVFVLHGPWERRDFDVQTAGRPWMALYWAAYYGAFLWATATFGISTLRSRSERPRGGRWGMDLAAAGAFVGVLWALLSAVNIILQEPESLEQLRFLGIRTRYLIATSSVLLTVGIMGHLLSAARTRRRRRAELGALHSHLVDAVAESRLPAVRPEVAEYHRTIEIMDALATLARYSEPQDAARVRALVGDVPEPVLRALQIDLAATRRGMDERPPVPADWGDWVSDDQALRDLGRAFREQTGERRASVLVSVLGYDGHETSPVPRSSERDDHR